METRHLFEKSEICYSKKKKIQGPTFSICKLYSVMQGIFKEVVLEMRPGKVGGGEGTLDT